MKSILFALFISVLLAGTPSVSNTEATPTPVITTDSGSNTDRAGAANTPDALAATNQKYADAADFVSNPDDPVYSEASFSTDGSQDVPVKTGNPVFFWCVTGVLAVVVIGGIAVILIRRHRMNSY